MMRRVLGFDRQASGWSLVLSCGHRPALAEAHDPWLAYAGWVDSPAGRTARIGTPVECPECARGQA
jgi:hypothetical protein